MLSVCYRLVALVLFMSSTVSARPYFLHTKSSWDTSTAVTTLPGTDLTRTNLLRMVTHNALLDAFFLHQPLEPIERLSLYKKEAREELQHPSLLELDKAVSLVKDVHQAMFSTPAHAGQDPNDQALLRINHFNQIFAINDLTKWSSSVAKVRLAMIDFLLAKTNDTEDEEGSTFLPSILYAIIATAMPPAVHNNKLGLPFVSTTYTPHLRDQHGKPIIDLREDDIDRDALMSLPQAQLDAVLMRAAQALEFIVARHAETAQDSYWVGVEETERQAYKAFAAQDLPVQRQTLAKIKKVQAIADAEQRKAATIEFLLSYVAGRE